MSALSAAVLLFLVMDPLGNIPLFVVVLKDVEEHKRTRIVLREHFIALVVLSVFLFAGPFLMDLFQIRGPALSVAGGIILFLIALRMIFAEPEDVFGQMPGGEPFIVPLAVPFIAGPSAMTTVLLLATQHPDRWQDWMLALLGAWLASIFILLMSTQLSRALGSRALAAFERLMGMLLTAIAVQMFMDGVRRFIEQR
jgi:multiple antibiotic resistance protein